MAISIKRIIVPSFSRLHLNGKLVAEKTGWRGLYVPHPDLGELILGEEALLYLAFFALLTLLVELDLVRLEGRIHLLLGIVAFRLLRDERGHEVPVGGSFGEIRAALQGGVVTGDGGRIVTEPGVTVAQVEVGLRSIEQGELIDGVFVVARAV